MCDAVFFCDGWYKCKRCRLEADVAIMYKLQEYGRFEDVPKTDGHE